MPRNGEENRTYGTLVASKNLGGVLVNMATLSWATNAVLGRWLRADIGPLTLTALRLPRRPLFRPAAVARTPSGEPKYGKNRWWLRAMGWPVLGFSPLLYLGLRYSTAVNSSLIQGFSPLITAVIAGIIFRNRSAGGRRQGRLWGVSVLPD